jgi:SAM-dependent methyltransferase
METQADWWRTFFTGPIVDFWLAVPTDELTRAEADFIEEALDPGPRAEILDVPCGGGRHCRELAGRGFAMTGVDVSSDFLDAAKAGPPGRPGSIAWEEREMRDLPWPGRFAGAFSFGNSFGYLDDEGNAEFLRATARALRPGGRFALEACYVAEIVLPTYQDRTWFDVAGMLILAQRCYDPATSRLHVEYRLIRDGKAEARAMSARIYSCREILELLSGAGFADVQLYGSLAREPFRLGSSRLLAVATKAGPG